MTQKEAYLKDEPLNEVCDCCDRRIIHWDHIYRAFLSMNGVDILCRICKNEEDNEIQNDQKRGRS